MLPIGERDRSFQVDMSSKVVNMRLPSMIFPLWRRTRGRMAMVHLRRVAACAQKLEDVRQDRDDAIREAYASGETMRDIAKHAGMSHQRVQQIVSAARKR